MNRQKVQIYPLGNIQLWIVSSVSSSTLFNDRINPEDTGFLKGRF
jgi:hypothetical protein